MVQSNFGENKDGMSQKHVENKPNSLIGMRFFYFSGEKF